MTDLSVTYMGLKLKSPIIVGSSSISSTMHNIKNAENASAGAIVLKSIFEEEIYSEYEDILANDKSEMGASIEYLDYFDFKIKEENIKKYISLIAEAKKETSIPIIGSINCISKHEWMFFAKKIEKAGADALELNLFIMPSDVTKSALEIEDTYMSIAKEIKNEITIPVALKISHYFTNLAEMVKSFSETGIDGIVLFNRFFAPDFDIENFQVVPTNVLSSPSDINLPLRWVSILSDRISIDIAASTGIHDSKGVIKQLLAGAKAVQVASVLYEKGIDYISVMLTEVEGWMKNHNFSSIEEFRGKMSQAKHENPAVFERAQFMKYFGNKIYDLD